MKIAAMMANGFEEVEALAVIDILRRESIEIDMVSVADTEDNLVEGAHKISVKADKKLTDIDINDYDAIFLPGGMPGTINLENCNELAQAIKDFDENGKMLVAICAAPKVFGGLGILEGKKATCFPSFEEELKGATVVDEKVVVDGNIITSRGMGTAIELGLKLVELIKDVQTADNLRSTIQYR